MSGPRPVEQGTPRPAQQFTPGEHAQTGLATQRVGILVDLNSLLQTARAVHGARVSYSKVARTLGRGRQVGRMVAYFSDRAAGGREAAEGVQHVSSSGFEVRGQDLPCRDENDWPRMVAVAMSVDAAAMAERCDAVVLLTHDPVMAVVAKALAARGVRVEVAGFVEKIPDALRQSAGHVIALGRDCLFVP